MIKKIRKKFILFSMLSVFGILAITFTTVNVVNFVTVTSDADQITAYLIDNNGRFPDIKDKEGDFEFPGQQSEATSDSASSEEERPPAPPGGRETSHDTRFFSVIYTPENDIIVNTRAISSFTVEEATALANKYKSKEKGWANTYYRFRFKNMDDGSRLGIFVDFYRQLKPSYTFLWTSLGAGGLGLLIAFILVYILSNKVVSPIAQNNMKQKRFISDASHELKTPITIISANTEMIELTQGKSEETRIIKKELNKLTDMVRNLNTLAKVQEQDQTILKSCDLSGICKDIASEFKNTFENKSIEFTSNIEENITNKSNEQVLRKILEIVLENASKYALTSTVLTLRKESNRILLEVENDATLEKEGDLDDVFERFYRSRNARASDIDGSGIGLAMAYDLTNLIQGRIKARGENGKFKIIIQL